ncbi:MAG: hypothetical protein ACR2J4_08710 [Deinococcus sp.]
MIPAPLPPGLKLALAATLLLFAGLYALGLALQLRVSRHRARWPHHALFFLVSASTALTGGLAWRSGRVWWPLGVALGLLLAMPATRPGRPGHALLATGCGLALGLAAWQLY